jgi:hypothetical protein
MKESQKGMEASIGVGLCQRNGKPDGPEQRPELLPQQDMRKSQTPASEDPRPEALLRNHPHPIRNQQKKKRSTMMVNLLISLVSGEGVPSDSLRTSSPSSENFQIEKDPGPNT